VVADPAKVLLIGMLNGSPAGVVRFDLADGRAEVSIYLAPATTAPGLGGELLLAAEEWLRKNRPEVSELQARVRGDNERSARLFAGAGYGVHSTQYSKRLEANG
jgi:L-amino acid N-acyltransferase YncA